MAAAVVLAFPLLAWAFVRWEQRTVARGHPPLLDVSLLRGLPGYANGLLVGTFYFTGFTGIFLVLSVHLQEGVGFSPLQAALLLTPSRSGPRPPPRSPGGWSAGSGGGSPCSRSR